MSATGAALSLILLHAAVPQNAANTGIDKLAVAVVADALAAQAEAPVAVFVRPDSPELAQVFTSLLCAKLAAQRAPCVPLEGIAFKDAEGLARQQGARSLLRVSLSLEQGLLHARGDLISTWVNFWSGATPTRAATPFAQVARTADVDAFALALFAAAPPMIAQNDTTQPRPVDEGAFHPTVIARLPNQTAALAVADLDGDRKAELLALTEDELFVLSPAGAVLARRELRALPFSPTPCREPYGLVSAVGLPARIRYVSSRRARGEALSFDRAGLHPLPWGDEVVLLAAGRASVDVVPQPGIAAAEVRASFAGEPRAPLAGGPFTTVSTFALPTAGAWVLAVSQEGNALLSSAPGQELRLTGFGAGSALVDLDGDGAPELATSSPEFSPAHDEVRVLTLPAAPAAPEELRFKAEIPEGRVLQLAGGDLDGDGAQELVAAAWLPGGGTAIYVFQRRGP